MAGEILKIIAWSLLIVVWILLIYYMIMQIRLRRKHADQLEDALHELVNVIAEQHKVMRDYVDSVLENMSDMPDEDETEGKEKDGNQTDQREPSEEPLDE